MQVPVSPGIAPWPWSPKLEVTMPMWMLLMGLNSGVPCVQGGFTPNCDVTFGLKGLPESSTQFGSTNWPSNCGTAADNTSCLSAIDDELSIISNRSMPVMALFATFSNDEVAPPVPGPAPPVTDVPVPVVPAVLLTDVPVPVALPPPAPPAPGTILWVPPVLNELDSPPSVVSPSCTLLAQPRAAGNKLKRIKEGSLGRLVLGLLMNVQCYKLAKLITGGLQKFQEFAVSARRGEIAARPLG